MDIRDFGIMVKNRACRLTMCSSIQNGTVAEKSLHWKTIEVGGWDYGDGAKEISSFIQVIHRDRKKLGIPPEIVPTWIRFA